MAEGPDFYPWFRAKTEALWQDAKPETLAKARERGVGSSWWRPGTRWQPGLTEAEITTLETTEGRAFPKDYRLFLSELGGGPDQPRIAYRFKGQNLVETEDRPFPNWRDPEDIKARRDNILGSILFHVEHGEWLDAWGPAPADRAAHVRQLFATAPPILPVFLHRLAPSVYATRLPVLSCHGMDTILWGASIPNALMHDFFPKDAPHQPVLLPPEYGFWRDLVRANG